MRTPHLAVLLSLLALTAPAIGQGSGLVDPSAMPGPLKEVGFEQRLGESLPLDAMFVNEEGRPVSLGEYFHRDKPVVLAFVYYDCPMLCSLIMNGVAKSLRVLSPEAGRDFDVVAISFAPGETPAMARETEAETITRYGKATSQDGWHFLSAPVGAEESIRRATEAAGFRYTWVPDADEYAHASGIVVATPEGHIAQYFYGIEYPPRDLRLALVEASANRLGSLVDQLLLYCFRYDPTLGKYTAAVTRILRLTGVVFVVALGLFLWVMLRREHRPQTLGAA